MRDQIKAIQNEVRSLRIAQQQSGEQPDQRTMVAKRNQVARLEGILKTVDEKGKPFTYGMGVQDGEPVNSHVLMLGDVEQKAQLVERGFLEFLSDVPTEEIKPNSSGRRELSHWIGSKDNPLTARVMVNRVWMHLMGAPLMDSPNNWGLSSQPPANPELLDTLAVKFMDQDWSVKKLIREIVLSQTYQRASTFDKENYKTDPDNKTLWRANPRQLDAESLRDAMLAVSSLLNTERPLGSEIAKVGDAKIGRIVDKSSFEKLNVHRSVYLPILRDSVPESLALFDFADPNSPNSKRETTNVPSQSLYLMNNDYVTYLSQHMAIELSKEHKTTIDQVRHAFLTVYGRVATKEEIKLSGEFFKRYSQVAVALPGDVDESETTSSRRKRIESFRNQRLRRGMRPDGAQLSRPTDGPFQFVSSPVGVQGKQDKAKQKQGAEQSNRATQRLERMKRAMGMQDSTDRAERGARLAAKMNSQLPKLKLSKDQQILAVFCQSLMASAEFRILD